MALPMRGRDRKATRIQRRLVGEPTVVGDRTIQPVAQMAGWYLSTGTEPNGGAGAGGRVAPRGYIRIASDGVKFEPIMDQARIALAGIAMSAWSVFWISKTIRTFATKEKR